MPETERTGDMPLSGLEESVPIAEFPSAPAQHKTSAPPTIPEGASLSMTDPSRYSPFSEQRAEAPSEATSHTTMQSMQRPELKPGGIPHTRRFLSIERDLQQQSASTRLIAKQLESARREARLALALATIALLAAVLAWLL